MISFHIKAYSIIFQTKIVFKQIEAKYFAAKRTAIISTFFKAKYFANYS